MINMWSVNMMWIYVKKCDENDQFEASKKMYNKWSCGGAIKVTNNGNKALLGGYKTRCIGKDSWWTENDVSCQKKI